MKKTWLIVGGYILVAVLAFLAGSYIPRALFGFGGAPNFANGGGPFFRQGGGGSLRNGTPPAGGQFFGQGERISGQITALDDTSLTLQNSSGTMTFGWDANTRFTQVGTYAGMQVGDFVQVIYQTSDGNDVALSVDTFVQN